MFLTTLRPWPRLAKQYLWTDPDRPELSCFGTGYNSWGVQTNQKFLGAIAVLATADETDQSGRDSRLPPAAPEAEWPEVWGTETEVSQDELLDWALRALRYSLASHVSGDHHCSDGTQWGHTWISGLGIERMLHGVTALRPHLTEADQAALQRVLCSEADWLLDFNITGTLWAADGGNRPESNIWNGAICARAALLYPDEPRVADWLEKAHAFFINGISIPDDATSDAVLGGRPIRDRFIGPNFFPHYALDHHGYLNVGYMVICLSNIAMLHYGLLLEGLQPPETLYHHARELWNLVRLLIFDNGRLLRIGGDSRQRYCYCQDYLLPTLYWAAEYLGDERAWTLEREALELIRTEQRFNGDGSFLSSRLDQIRRVNPYYYTRLESDKAVVLSMNEAWRRCGGDTQGELSGGVSALARLRAGADEDPATARAGRPLYPLNDDPTPTAWEEPEHGAIFVRSPRRLASWSWRAREAPQGLCLPLSEGHLAEWCENLGGRVRIAGEQSLRAVQSHWQQAFPGGFLTTGLMHDSIKAYFGEGWTSPERAPHRLAVAALPDDRTMIVLERATVNIRSYLTECKGLKLNVPNDLFNGFERRYFSASGVMERRGEEFGIHALGSAWANVDDRLGVVGLYGGETVTLYQAGKRRASGYEDSLYYDELCFPCRAGLWDEAPGAVVLDCGSAVLSGADHRETEAVAGTSLSLPTWHDLLRAVIVAGADGRRYLFCASFAVTDLVAELEVATATDVVTGETVSGAEGVIHLPVPASQARLLVI